MADVFQEWDKEVGDDVAAALEVAALACPGWLRGGLKERGGLLFG